MTIPQFLRTERLDRDARLALCIVGDAMRVARSLQGQIRPATKSDASQVTVADLAIQAVVSERLRRAHPDDLLIAEEDAAPLRANPELSRQVVEAVGQVVPDATIEQVASWIERTGSRAARRSWALDPIDGTSGFIHGRQYAMALALLVAGRVEMSVIGCPHLSIVAAGDAAQVVESPVRGGIAIAVRGGGAWWSADGEDTCLRLRVSSRRDASEARIVHSCEARHGDPARFARALRCLGSHRPPWLMDSQAKHVTIAAGASDLLMRFPPHGGFHDAVWDQAAGSLLIEEAGGQVTDLAGRPLDFRSGRRLLRNTGMLASNGVLHAAALEAVGAAGSLRAWPPSVATES